MSDSKIRGEDLTLSEGEFKVKWPETLSVSSFLTIADYLEGLIGRILDSSGITAQQLLLEIDGAEADATACDIMRDELGAEEFMVKRFLVDERAKRKRLA